MENTMLTTKRWSLINKKSGIERMRCATRFVARGYKRATERMFDNVNMRYAR